jgi:hypothetical protein
VVAPAELPELILRRIAVTGKEYPIWEFPVADETPELTNQTAFDEMNALDPV